MGCHVKWSETVYVLGLVWVCAGLNQLSNNFRMPFTGSPITITTNMISILVIYLD